MSLITTLAWRRLRGAGAAHASDQPEDITRALDGLTDRVVAYRHDRIIKRGTAMPLEIKGLKGKAIKTGAMFDRLNRAYDKLIETGSAHADDVESLPSQIEGMQDDLTFMVQHLGNSVSDSGEPPSEAQQGDAPRSEPEA